VVTDLDHIRNLVLHHDCADRNTLYRASKGQPSTMQMNGRSGGGNAHVRERLGHGDDIRVAVDRHRSVSPERSCPSEATLRSVKTSGGGI
jgi:hypothetical protein